MGVWSSSFFVMSLTVMLQPASARGIGIKVVNKWKDVPKNKPIIVQR